MNKLVVNIYTDFEKELNFKKLWHITKKCLLSVVVCLFFILYAMFYFVKILLGGK